MSKYIDANRLNAEIERLYDGEAPKHDQQCDFDDGYFTGIGAVSQFIDSLKQDQSELTQVPCIEQEIQKKGWVDYGLLMSEIGLHRSNAIDRIKETKERVTEIKRNIAPHDLAILGEYLESVGKEIVLCCLQQYCMDSMFTQDEVKEILQQEQSDNMIQWTGNNLKEVIDFTGKSPKFDEWFKSWDEFESYVHSHGNILKLFSEDGSHFEVPVGSWIIKTPDGYNVPSVARFIHAKREQPEVNLEEKMKEYFGDDWRDGTPIEVQDDMIQFARHFINLGFNARKEE